MRVKFTCRQCGSCCRKHGGRVRASTEDVQRWEREGRQDILEHFGSPRGEDGCAFLKKRGSRFVCAIQKTKPEACREYPFLVNARALKGRLKECRGMRLVRETGDDERFCRDFSI